MEAQSFKDELKIINQSLTNRVLVRNLESQNWPYRTDKDDYRIYDSQQLIQIPLRNRRKVIVRWALCNLKHMEKLKQYSYCLFICHGKEYVSSTGKTSMQEIIMGKPEKGYLIDHDNSNGLDNREENLRMVPYDVNAHNKKKKKGVYTSDFSGVAKVKNIWRSSIKMNEKSLHLGRFDTEIEAARVRDMWALKIYGEFARLNELEGKYLLTQEEIENILENGVPKEYDKSVATSNTRNLPPCIYENKKGGFYYLKTFRRHTYKKSYPDLISAVQGLNDLLQQIQLLKAEERYIRENNIERNFNGVAVLYTKNKNKEINGVFLIDDEMWKHLCNLKWHIGNFQRLHNNLNTIFLTSLW